MHEVGLMANILDTISSSAQENNISRIREITLIVGKFTMVLPDSMLFAFEALKQNDPLYADATLTICEKNIECLCEACNKTFLVEQNHCFICPDCTSSKVKILSGRELYIDCYEGD